MKKYQGINIYRINRWLEPFNVGKYVLSRNHTLNTSRWLEPFNVGKYVTSDYTLNEIISFKERFNADPQGTLKEMLMCDDDSEQKYFGFISCLAQEYCVTYHQLQGCTVKTHSDPYLLRIIADGFAPLSNDSTKELLSDEEELRLHYLNNEDRKCVFLYPDDIIDVGSFWTSAEVPLLTIIQERLGEKYYYTHEELVQVLEQLSSKQELEQEYSQKTVVATKKL